MNLAEGHSSQVTASVAGEYVPAAQGMHSVYPEEGADFPLAQDSQAVDRPTLSPNLPGSQGVHRYSNSIPNSVLYLPAIHEVHEFAPTRSEYEPGAQPVQALVPEVNAL